MTNVVTLAVKKLEDGILQYKQKRPVSLPPAEPDAGLAEEGFPKEVSKAFQKAANKLNCVIWSRVPGKACTTLIDEGYNLKPFYVHGKSCNWGPMAGFVCQLPALNKKGASKMAYNLKEHRKSLEWLGQKQVEAIRSWEKENKEKPDIENEDKYRDMGVADSLFLPLVISDARKQELLTKNFLPNHKTIGNDLIYGIAQDDNKTVAVEYLMKKRTGNSNLWDIYHKNIYIKDENGYINYLQKNGDKFSIRQEDSTEYNADIRTSINQQTISNQTRINTELDQLLITLNLNPVKNNALDQFYAVNGIQSPYLAYTDEASLYKNAVSGDYDLFAVWPFTPNSSFEMTTRISERVSKPSESDKIQRLFIPVEAKENAVEFTKSRNVFIEFIGTYQELNGKEDPELGNINDLVSLTAQTLNSLVQAQYLGKGEPDKGQFPNRAFHSDEGGRPGVDEIEYPIAVFIPRSQWSNLKYEELRLEEKKLIKERPLKNTSFLVENHIEFLSLVLLLRTRFYVFLHDGWFMHWMCLAAGRDKMNNLATTDFLSVPGKVKGYFEARSEEIDDLGESLKIIDLQLRTLLTSRPETDEAADEAFLNVRDSFIEIALLSDLSAEERKTMILDLSVDEKSKSPQSV